MAISIKMDSWPDKMNKQQKQYQVLHNGNNYDCPISLAMALVGGKWKGVILYYLKTEKRFNELKKNISSITEMTLSLQLKQLELDGLITRQVFGEKPPIKVVYSLTPLGEKIIPVLESLCYWAQEVAKDKFIQINTKDD